MLKSTRDLLWALFFIVLSVGIFFYSGSFTGSEEIPRLAEPSVYARIWAVALLLLSALLFIRSLRSKETAGTLPLLTFGAVLSVAALLLYLLAFQYLGFVICTTLFLTLLMSYYHYLSLDSSNKKSFCAVRTILKYFAFSIALSFLFNFIFGTVLSVYLPAGTLVESLFL